MCVECLGVAACRVADVLHDHGNTQPLGLVEAMYPREHDIVLAAALQGGSVYAVGVRQLCHAYTRILLSAKASTGVTDTSGCTQAHCRFIHAHHAKHGLYYNGRHHVLKVRTALNMFNRQSILRGVGSSFPRGIRASSIVSEYNTAYLDVYALTSDGSQCFESGGLIWSRPKCALPYDVFRCE